MHREADFSFLIFPNQINYNENDKFGVTLKSLKKLRTLIPKGKKTLIKETSETEKALK